MSPEQVRKTVFSKWFKGVRKNHVGKQQKFILCGMDTETYYGQVFAMGFSSDTGYQQIYGLKQNYLFEFLDLLFEVGKGRRETVVCAAHYLSFDLSVLLWPYLYKGQKLKKAPKVVDMDIPERHCHIFAVMGKPCFAKIRHKRQTYYVIDTWGFYGCNLATALKNVGGVIQKQEKPKDLGKRVIPQSEVTPYLKADTDGVRELLKQIILLHEDYQVRLCVSLPQLAARIFRHHYMRRDFIRQPKVLQIGAMFSYHGGKNTWVGKPGWHENVWDLDIRSAFPEAMAQLPDFEHGEWVRTESIEEGLKNEAGIYCIDGISTDCRWGSLFNHEFKKLVGRFTKVWVTGYELKEAIRSNEVDLKRLRGYFYRGDGGDSSAFNRFTTEFFNLKEGSANPIKRSFYKLILNSLYGKFIQRTEKEDGTKEVGSMFDPVIASLITGYVRAKIHRLEHKYNSLHTATDGFLTKLKPDPKDIGEGIGQLKQENFGRCLIIRNKLYVHYDQNGNVFKRGLHGFQGDVKELISLYKKKKSDYEVERLVRWGEAWHIGIPPGFPLKRKMKLNYEKV